MQAGLIPHLRLLCDLSFSAFRFDLLHVMLDEVDEAKDDLLARHVVDCARGLERTLTAPFTK